AQEHLRQAVDRARGLTLESGQLRQHVEGPEQVVESVDDVERAFHCGAGNLLRRLTAVSGQLSARIGSESSTAEGRWLMAPTSSAVSPRGEIGATLDPWCRGDERSPGASP